MGLFKKGEVYDYTLLQKRGYLKVPEPKKSAGKVTKDGYFELGVEELADVPPESMNSAGRATVNESSPLSFFDNFSANAGESPGVKVNPLESFDTLGSSSSGGVSGIQTGDLQDLSVKVEDFEYKLARIADKLAMIEAKLEEFESKFR